MPRQAAKAVKTKRAVKAPGKTKVAAPKIPRIAEIAMRLGQMIPEEERRRIPKDLSSQIDHYVYGTPKR